MNIVLTNIQRFSLHDGPGIRTTVFLKGCSLRCPWCSNPENLESNPQKYFKDGVQGTYGKYYSTSELVAECLKDKNFYEGKIQSPSDWNIGKDDQIDRLPGGVTFSGGEALLQIEALAPVIDTLHNQDIHIAVETCLFAPLSAVVMALNLIDFFYIDMKILDEERCKTVEHGNLELYLANLNTVLTWKNAYGDHKPVVIRIPVIGSYTDTNENRKTVYDLIKRYRNSILKIELIKEHNLAESKYRSLNMKMDYHGVEDSLMEQYKEELSDLGIIIEVCKI
jgi:pyruvate formate lyase activating enzyme